MQKHVVQTGGLHRQAFSSSLRSRASSINSCAEAGPRSLDMRYVAEPSARTDLTAGSASRSAAPLGRSGSNCNSMRLAPGTEAFSATGVSSATMRPLSTIATRSQRRSASSM